MYVIIIIIRYALFKTKNKPFTLEFVFYLFLKHCAIIAASHSPSLIKNIFSDHLLVGLPYLYCRLLGESPIGVSALDDKSLPPSLDNWH